MYKLFLSIPIFLFVENTSFIASNKSIWTRWLNWKQASWLFLIKNEPSAIVKPTIQLLKKSNLRNSSLFEGNK